MEVLSLNLPQIKALAEGVLSIMASPKGLPFSSARREVYNRVEIKDSFYGCEKLKKTSWLSDFLVLKRQCIYSS